MLDKIDPGYPNGIRPKEITWNYRSQHLLLRKARVVLHPSLICVPLTMTPTASFPIQCTGTLAVHGFIQHVTNRSETEVVIIGADCSVASQPLANLAQFWNLVQVRHKYMSIIILYIGFHLQSSIIPMICLHAGINSFYISSIVWWEQLPHFPAPCSPWQQYSTRDCKTDAAFWLEAYCHHYSRGRHIYTGIYINTI